MPVLLPRAWPNTVINHWMLDSSPSSNQTTALDSVKHKLAIMSVECEHVQVYSFCCMCNLSSVSLYDDSLSPSWSDPACPRRCPAMRPRDDPNNRETNEPRSSRPGADNHLQAPERLHAWLPLAVTALPLMKNLGHLTAFAAPLLSSYLFFSSLSWFKQGSRFSSNTHAGLL